jgi:hypothetical protein
MILGLLYLFCCLIKANLTTEAKPLVVFTQNCWLMPYSDRTGVDFEDRNRADRLLQLFTNFVLPEMPDILFLQEVWKAEGMVSFFKPSSAYAVNRKVENYLKTNGFKITKSTPGGYFKSLNSGLVIATTGEILYQKFSAFDFDSTSTFDSDKTKGILAAGIRFPDRTILAITSQLDVSKYALLKLRQLRQLSNLIREAKKEFPNAAYTVFAGDLQVQLRDNFSEEEFFPGFKNGWDQNTIVKTYAGLFGEFEQVFDYVYVQEGEREVKNIHLEYPLPLEAWLLSDSEKVQFISKKHPKNPRYHEIEKWFRKNKSTSHAGILAKIT